MSTSADDSSDRPWVTRVQITGGFLSGLDLPLSRGLNVIVGPRGAGKTTLLELIRYALGAPTLVSDAELADRNLVRHLLHDGEVILDLAGVGDRPRRVIASADGHVTPHLFDDHSLFIGQNGLEEVASSPKSRARLIDLQAGVKEMEVSKDIASFTQEMFLLRQSITQMQEELRARPSLEHDLEQLAQKEQDWNEGSGQDARQIVSNLQTVESEFRIVSLERDKLNTLMEYTRNSGSLAQRIQLDLHSAERLNYSGDAGERLASASQLAAVLSQQLALLLESTGSQMHAIGELQDVLRAQIVALRAELERRERGHGEVAERVANARLALSGFADLEQQLERERERYRAFDSLRQSALEQRERVQELRYFSRSRVGQAVSRSLGDRVQIIIDHLGDSTSFNELLSSALQGSGLKYSNIAESLAQSLLPRNLLECLEESRSDELARITGISQDRATKLVDALSTAVNLALIADASLEDSVQFFLRDGGVSKDMDNLSTGQKVATVLPIILTDGERALFLDQPEDHLDNAFLVENVISAITSRSERGAQTIVATHNPNIPVLGSAKVVCALTSDGRRAVVKAVGTFDDSNIVDIITNLMEGGSQAFQRRARFYRRFGTLG